MAKAPDYTKATDFSTEELNLASGRSTLNNAKLDTELENLGAAFNALNANVQLIQRDDGRMRDASVEPHALSDSLRLLLRGVGAVRGDWAAGTTYNTTELVRVNAVWSLVAASHTAGSTPSAANFIALGGGSGGGASADAVAQALAAAQQAQYAASQAQAAVSSVTQTAESVATSTATELLNAALSNLPSGNGDLTAYARALLMAAVAAANAPASATPDPTLPPIAGPLTGDAGLTTINLTWPAPSYTQGHGHRWTNLYAAKWTGSTGPAYSTAEKIGPIVGTNRATVPVNPGDKYTFWIRHQSIDNFEGPESGPFVATARTIGAGDIGNGVLEARMISDAIQTGRLVNDPSFAAGPAVWNGLQRRLPASDPAVPPGCPYDFAAEFKGRDCIQNRSFTVKPGDSYRLTVNLNSMSTGFTCGIVVYEDYANGAPTVAKSVTVAPLANSWRQCSGVITAGVGASRWRIGPNIGQPHSGTSPVWFAEINCELMISTSLIVGGSITAAALAADAVQARNLSADALQVIDAKVANLTVDAAQISGLLDASQIDTRGLEIKDSSGSVIFGAGTKLGTAYISIGAASEQHFLTRTATASSTSHFASALSDTSSVIGISNRGLLHLVGGVLITATPAPAAEQSGPAAAPASVEFTAELLIYASGVAIFSKISKVLIGMHKIGGEYRALVPVGMISNLKDMQLNDKNGRPPLGFAIRITYRLYAASGAEIAWPASGCVSAGNFNAEILVSENKV